MATVYQRKSKSDKHSWYCYFRVQGKRYRKKLDAQNKTQAQAIANKLERDVINGEYGLVKKDQSFTLKELSDRYIEYVKDEKSSWDRDIVSLRNILQMEIENKKFGNYHIHQITTQHVKLYQIQRKRELDEKLGKKGISERERNFASVNRELACLKHVFYLAIDWELMDKNPVASKSIKFYKEIRRNRILSEDEIARLLSVTSEHTYQIICVALNTGMRKSEIMNLKWENLDLQNQRIHVRFTKTGNDRDIPINSFLIRILMNIQKFDEYVFVHQLTKRPIKVMRTSFATALEKAKIKNFRFHDMRHCFASYLTMKGVDEITRAELLGHSKRSMTMSYSHSTWEQKKKAVEVMASLSVHVLSTQEKSS